jgi:hypothetical protein
VDEAVRGDSTRQEEVAVPADVAYTVVVVHYMMKTMLLMFAVHWMLGVVAAAVVVVVSYNSACRLLYDTSCALTAKVDHHVKNQQMHYLDQQQIPYCHLNIVVDRKVKHSLMTPYPLMMLLQHLDRLQLLQMLDNQVRVEYVWSSIKMVAAAEIMELKRKVMLQLDTLNELVVVDDDVGVNVAVVVPMKLLLMQRGEPIGKAKAGAKVPVVVEVPVV